MGIIHLVPTENTLHPHAHANVAAGRVSVAITADRIIPFVVLTEAPFLI